MPRPRHEHDSSRIAPRWPRFDDVHPDVVRRDEGAYLTTLSIRRTGWRAWLGGATAAVPIEARAPG